MADIGVRCVVQFVRGLAGATHILDAMDSLDYPPTMKISLVALGVSDLPNSVAFYRDKAGFDLQNQFGSIAFFSAGPVMLMLNGGLRRPEGPLAGAMEIVVAAESVTASYRELIARGCNFINEPREVTSGSWAATFSDPDGHWLTLFGPN